MFEPGQVLLSETDFDNVMFFGVDVIFWQNGNIIDYGGTITNHINDSVFIRDANFIKQNCLFKTR